MVLATLQRRAKLADLIKQAVDENKVSGEIKEAFTSWLTHKDNAEQSQLFGDKIKQYLETNHDDFILLEYLVGQLIKHVLTIVIEQPITQ